MGDRTRTLESAVAASRLHVKLRNTPQVMRQATLRRLTGAEDFFFFLTSLRATSAPSNLARALLWHTNKHRTVATPRHCRHGGGDIEGVRRRAIRTKVVEPQ